MVWLSISHMGDQDSNLGENKISNCSGVGFWGLLGPWVSGPV